MGTRWNEVDGGIGHHMTHCAANVRRNRVELVWSSVIDQASLRGLAMLTVNGIFPSFIHNRVKKLVAGRVLVPGKVWLCTSLQGNVTFRALVRPCDIAFVKSHLIHAVLTALSLMGNLVVGKPHVMNIWYMPAHVRKRLPDVLGSTITCDHVNSGLTWYRGTGDMTNVIVYRHEEACKVMIHEIIHAMGCSFDPDPRIDESFVDALACYVHSRWSLHTRPELTMEAVVKKTREHILDVASRICHHFRDRSWRETTHAYAYYIGKAALWFDLSRTLSVIRGRFSDRPMHTGLFAAFLDERTANASFVNNMRRRLRILETSTTIDKSLTMAPSIGDIHHPKNVASHKK